MARRGKKAVSLPKLKGLSAKHRATDHPTLPLDGEHAPTPERLLKLPGVVIAHSVTTRGLQAVFLPPNTKEDVPVGQDRVVRISQAPLDRLHARRQLGRTGKDGRVDVDHNDKLFAAGDRVRQHCYHAGLSGIGSVDLNRAGGGGSDPAWMTPASETAAYHREKVRRAREEVQNDDIWQVVFGVCFEEMDLTSAGREAGYGNDAGATAAAMALLRCGLETVAILFGILPPRPANSNVVDPTDYRFFEAWCLKRDLDAMPASAETVEIYVTLMGELGLPTALISRRLAAIRQVHEQAGQTSPTGDGLVTKAVRRLWLAARYAAIPAVA